MSIYIGYTLCIWLPVIVPATVILVFNSVGLRLSDGVVAEVLAYSLIYGGVPYSVLAAWATWWIRGRTEADIRWLMLRAPGLMVAIFAPLAVVVGVAVGNVGPFVAVAVVGSLMILLLGYAYVGVAVLLRYVLGPRAA